MKFGWHPNWSENRLISSLVQLLIATTGVNITHAQLLRELLPMPRDSSASPTSELTWGAASE